LATARCEDPEVQAIIEAGTASVQWVCAEFAGADLSDRRLDRRLIKTAEHLASSPASPINEACGDWASAQAAYRLFDNGKASPQAILAPHIQATVKRMLAVGGPVLVMQDTVFFSYRGAKQNRQSREAKRSISWNLRPYFIPHYPKALICRPQAKE
jgi:hypothetical protein